MLPQSVVIAALAVGLPACLARLWWLWWTGTCIDCGFARSACDCPDRPMMRPRR